MPKSVSLVLPLAVATALLASNGVSTYPQPLMPKAPLGNLIYDPSASGTIAAAGDTASFTLPVNGGQTISLVVLAATPGLQPTVTVVAPSNAVIASATAPAAGAAAVVQVVPASATGTYTFTVTGASGSTGNFSLQVVLNAMLDSATYGGTANSTIATAQDLNASSFSLGTSADRLGVVGHFEGTSHVYSFALAAGQSANLALTLASGGQVALQLRDPGNSVLATGIPGGSNVSLSIANFVAPFAGTYYAALSGSGPSDFNLVVTRGADFELENNDNAGQAQDLHAGVVLGAIGNGGITPDTDWFAFNVNAQQTITVSTVTPSDQGGEFHNQLVPQANIYDNNLVQVATNSGGAKNAPVVWTALAAGRYFARVTSANGSNGEYVLSANLSLMPDLAITKLATPNPVLTGSIVTYDLTLTNVGGAAAANVVVTDDLPASTVFVACLANGGGVCGGTGNHRTIAFATLGAGASAQIKLTARVNCPVPDGVVIKNMAVVAAAADANPVNNSATVSVVASNPAPVVSKVSVDKPVLWPPNHKMVNVTVNYTVMDNCGVPGCFLAVRSNEPPAIKEPDWQIIDAHHVLLRAERLGNGKGRVYTITVTCTDSAYNKTVRTVTVTVPHDQGKK